MGLPKPVILKIKHLPKLRTNWPINPWPRVPYTLQNTSALELGNFKSSNLGIISKIDYQRFEV